ncbi:hypothetical protein [Burkholderia cepacia]|uniref:hypothetical protein n=1 Tax=Burkholderia cepacia TaxID=292 RepID=UPI001CF5F30B|nr:hypothetical protein [Burkholderia cepacia]MCA8331876.1 hypothetical protein [Burkholderia cepacia]
MEDLNAAAPSSTEPAADTAPMTATELAALPDWIKNGRPAAQEGGGTAPDPIDATASNAAVASGEPSSASTSSDAPAVAATGGALATSDANASAPESSKPQQANSGVDVQLAGAGDDGNVDASLADGQSVSGTASSAQDASQGGDTAADALRAELDAAHARIAALEQQVTDEQERVIKWQGLYNAATATRSPEAAPTARRWLDVLERKVTSLEHDARAELLDVARQLREAL